MKNITNIKVILTTIHNKTKQSYFNSIVFNIYYIFMKPSSYFLVLTVINTIVNAGQPLVSSFMTYLTTPLSFLSDEDSKNEFDV